MYTAAALYAVGLSQNTGGLQSLHLAAVNPVTGAQLQTAWKHLPPSVSSFVVAGDTVIWVDHASESLGFVHLLPTLKGNIRTEKALKWLAIVDVDLREKELFVGVLTNGEAKVLQVQEGGVIKAIHSFPANDGPQALFAGGLDEAGEPFVARLWTTSSDVSFRDLSQYQNLFGIDYCSRHLLTRERSFDGLFPAGLLQARNCKTCTAFSFLKTTTNLIF